MIPSAKGFIFDMDGTLLSLPVDWEGLRSELKNVKSTYEFKPIFQTLERVIKERPELRERSFTLIDRFEMRSVPKAKLHDGAYEVLELLSKSSKMSLVTMQGKRVCEELFKRLNLNKFFPLFYTRDDSLDRAQQLEAALKGLELPKNDIIFIGDRLNDLNAAKKVGLRFMMIRGQVDVVDAEISYPNIESLLSSLLSDKELKIL
jgi:HAD superfamily hydrolase (TIGR01549 family)